MNSTKLKGDLGEEEVISLVFCPNCQKSLMLLPKSFPLYDVQCTACHFRAQVKSSNSKPKNTIRGAGWDIMDKNIKAGNLIAPLITNNKWIESGIERQKIRFYPFISMNNLRIRILPLSAIRANYKMFDYVGLDTLPRIILFEK